MCYLLESFFVGIFLIVDYQLIQGQFYLKKTDVLDLYESTGELLGQGSQGAVQCYRSKTTGAEFAVKVRNLCEV